jgi:hypothetical protein
MRFIFADSPDKFKEYTEKGWLYFFLTQLQPNDRQAFIKFGLTERSLKERLEDYSSLNIANIYAIRIPCEEVFIREGAMKRIFKICKIIDNIDIWEDRGIEYLRGDLNLMLRVFLYFSTSSLEEANLYKNKQRIIEPTNMINWLLNLPDLNNYNINMLSIPKKYKIDQEIKNILDNKINENNSISFNCEKCGRECKDKRGLTLHYNKCNGPQSLECEFCKEEFANHYNLLSHLTRCKHNNKIVDIVKKYNYTLDYSMKEDSNNNFINFIKDCLFPNVFEWIGLSFYDIGIFITSKNTHYFHTERDSKKDLYIIIHTDLNYNKKVYIDDLMTHILQSFFNIKLNRIMIQTMEALVRINKEICQEKASQVLKFLKYPNYQDTQEIMRGIVSL